ncbi:hypothetical protein CLAFUW4_05918 [Fulvia fulva]|uniref:Uncharacterized protein n=1 Tax=Passalora fulva TaxID=5499 RepID=A0A9Q8P9S6_PASFU|nr:uncharacterized protein CLAFUR5_06062 [Fulvia fulva]KAK4624559.1 hypothetical protein CLAFUR4_05923 [Fulvia fulva]KAK4625859.1 hypothetical protein CLAFUR0_05925 [Fulvia fulva]UJO18392.1 hypothetical protein CLAFUR5_06062 [Fulvia fulva]WPV14440.1 hypothetical protein CLAFUW4_05918 [Fulvia fulva]WPV29629.1 hypothetical protein CLAFUW7_05916 [Fulvia fulva]
MASRLTSTTTFQYLPPPAECLAILLGLAEVSIFGLAGITGPVEFSRGLGLPIDAPQAASANLTTTQKTQRALSQLIAARNVQNGVLILTFALYTRDRTALGIAIASGVITTLADAFVVNWYGLKDVVAFHAIGVVNSVLIGGSLLYWKREDKFFS